MELDGDKLRAARQRRFWSQQTLADKAGKTEATINRLEQGKQQARPSTILELAKALGVDALTLVKEHDDANG